MRHEDIIQLLMGLFSRFDFHPRMIQELTDIISGSGYEHKLFKLLLTRLNYLNMNGVLSTRHEEFEPIENGLYSMHLAKKEFNIRILYGFLPNKEPTMLLCFFERGGKRATDYSTYLEPAATRLAERKEAFLNGNYN